MGKQKPKPDKLSRKETIPEFILAIAQGADINETHREKPLVREYFEWLDDCGDFTRKSAQTMLKKLKILVAAGADTR